MTFGSEGKEEKKQRGARSGAKGEQVSARVMSGRVEGRTQT